MKKFSNFKVLFHYLRKEKIKLGIYILLVLLTYIPVLAAAYLWGIALEALIQKELMKFVLYLALWEGLFTICYSLLQIPRDTLYNYLEIKFMENVSKDLYKKMDSLPAKAFEEIGVGELINRLYTDPDRVMELLNKLIKLVCKAFVVIVVLVISFSVSILDNMFIHTRNIRKYEVTYYSLNNLTYFILQFIILFTAGYYVVQGKIAYSIFVMLEAYIWRIDEVVESISDFGVSYNKVTVSLKRIGEIVNNVLYEDEKFGKVNIKSKGIIELKDVWFRYSDYEDYTLKGLSMKIEPNKKIAVVGRSGNGKSTIFNLLLRYFDSTDGVITLDGVDIKDLSEKSLRGNISIIRQAPFLFNLSILDNFKLTKTNVTLKEVRNVCKRAYIDDYIMSLPNKYDTIIGEGGVNLSGGQKQRLAIARTLLLNTKVILFDEATSALDNESQEYIKKTIDNLVKDHTVVIVAHRLSTIVDADIINVIDKGKLAASGTHKQLLKSCKVYQGLYKTESSNSK